MSKSLVAIILPILSTLSFASTAGAVTSAELYRTEPLGFGKFEARLQFAGGGGVIGSFFLWKDGSERSDVYWNELDFETLDAACELQTNSIFGLPQSSSEGKDYGLTGLCEGYHTYAYEWTPEYIAWAVDGVEIRRDIGAAAAAYADNAAGGMQMRFNVWPGDATFGGNFDPSILPVYEYVAWAQYSEYTPGTGDDGSDFTLAWREEFDTSPAGWSMGSWDSPKGLSTHSPSNIVFVDGIAVLSLTADDATGFVGSPPPDGPSTATGGAAGGGDVTSTGGGDATSTGAGGTPPSMDGGGGKGCSVVGAPSPSRSGLALLGCVGALVWFAGRRRGLPRVGSSLGSR
jgi:endo-1,3-1,4-beta-glycanase ExoK